MLPQVTALALALATVVSGAVLVEAIFNYPGLGGLLFTSVLGKDIFVVNGVVIVLIVSLAVAVFLIDLIYPLLDPRIRHQPMTAGSVTAGATRRWHRRAGAGDARRDPRLTRQLVIGLGDAHRASSCSRSWGRCLVDPKLANVAATIPASRPTRSTGWAPTCRVGTSGR